MNPLCILVLLPFLAIGCILLGAPPRWTARAAAVAMLVLTGLLGVLYNTQVGGYQWVASWPVAPQLGIHLSFGLDGLSFALLLLVSWVTVAAVWVIPQHLEQERLFTICLLLIAAGVTGAFSSLDLVFFYAFHEMALIPTFLLIGLWGTGNRQAAAWKATLYLGLASFVLLLGILGLYLSLPPEGRTFDLRMIQALAQAHALHPPDWVYFLLLIGFGTLVSLFPFHSWAPPTYASAPPSAAMLHAGVLKKFGVYGLIRLVVPLFPEAMDTYLPFLLICLLGNLLYIGYVTLAQKRLDLMLGYSSVMHMGYLFLGIAGLNELSLSGAALLMVAHGLSIAALFALAGAIRDQTGTLVFSELGGLAQKGSKLGLLFGFATMAALGLPGFANFAGEVMVLFGAFGSAVAATSGWWLSPLQWAAVAGAWGVVISAVYLLRAYRKIFFGPLPAQWHDLTKEPIGLQSFRALGHQRHALMAAALLILALLVLGFYPQGLLNFITPALLIP